MSGTVNPYEISEIKGVKLPSRILRSATHEGMADENGRPNEQLIKLYERFARGGCGLIFTGYMGVSQQGKCPLYHMTMINSDELILAWAELTERVHAAGGTVFAQIAHCGRQTRKKVTGEKTVAPSAIRDFLYWEGVPSKLKEKEIRKIISDFGDAALRAKKAGFDGVQLHCAHGYLLSEFLSPHTNHRKDKWGGSTENRFRIVDEIMKEMRAKVGDFPIFVKMNCFEKDKDGIKTDEAVKIAKLMEKAGFDAIEVSCGLAKEGFNMSRGGFPYPAMCADNFRFENLPKFTWPLMKPVMKLLMGSPKPIFNYNVDAAAEIKKAVGVPVIVCGGIRTKMDVADILSQGKADYVSMSRPFILEPDIVSKFRDGKSDAAKCLNCNYCLMGVEQRPLRCYYGKLINEK